MTRPRRPCRSLLVEALRPTAEERAYLRGYATGVLLVLALLALVAAIAGLCALAGW